jgi:hypothetical protein
MGMGDPKMRASWVAIFAVLSLLAWPAAADQISGSMEAGYDRPGSDYNVVDLDRAEPTLCFSACAKADQCLAWTYVKPGIETAAARCHLKDNVPPDIPDPCCTSGVMTRAGDLDTLAAGSPSENDDPNHPWSQLRADGHWCVDDILAADYKPLFVQLSDTRETVYVFTNPDGIGYVGLSGCNRINWNWAAFHEAWVKETIDYPQPEDDPTYSKKVVYRHLNSGERVTIAYFR